MYLSSYSIPQGSDAEKQCRRNRENLHRMVLSLFPGLRHQHEGSILYRYIPEKERLYIQSAAQPSGSSLSLQEIGRMELTEKEPGEFLSFSLLAEPMESLTVQGGRSHRQPIREPDQKLFWLERQAEGSGFAIESIRLARKETIPFAHYAKQEGSGNCILHPVEFRGRLKVTDAEAFRKACLHGIGRGKAYGLGLLLLAPANP